MTEKLYYKDAYIKEFDAEVLSIEKVGDRIFAILDRTAFFPEEGGQSADTGFISGASVLNVAEREGIIYHELDSQVPIGSAHCILDFEARFERMQCHTAEHILCGIIHSMYGYENVGFHLGEELVTFDVDGELTRDQLDEIELLANRAVFANLAVTTMYPTPEELAKLTYRAKLDITEGVRIVTVDGVDSCACCAPHVARTGEIGIIKVLDFMRHRGGTRIFMLAGHRALCDYHHKYLLCKDIGALTSTPHNDIAEPVHAIYRELELSRRENKALRRRIVELYAEAVASLEGNLILYLPLLLPEDLRELADLLMDRTGGIVLLLTGEPNSYKYVIASRSIDIGATVRQMNSTLGGRGGGRGEMAQGTLNATLDEIKAYFE